MQLIDQYTLSAGLQFGDALIAATALEHRLPLLTGNSKALHADRGTHRREVRYRAGVIQNRFLISR